MKKIKYILMAFLVSLMLTNFVHAFTMTEVYDADGDSISIELDGTNIDVFQRDASGTYAYQDDILTGVTGVSYNMTSIPQIGAAPYSDLVFTTSKVNDAFAHDLIVRTIESSDISNIHVSHTLTNSLQSSDDVHIAKNLSLDDNVGIAYRDTDGTIIIREGTDTTFSTTDTGVTATEIFDIRFIDGGVSGDDVLIVAFNNSGNLDVLEYNIDTATAVVNEQVSTDIDTASRSVIAYDSWNSRAIIVSQTADDTAIELNYYTGAAWTTLDVGTGLTASQAFDADKLTIDGTNELIVAHRNGSDLIETTVDMDSLALTDNTVATSIDNDHISVGGFRTTGETVDMSRISYSDGGASYVAVESTSGSFDNEDMLATFNQQNGGAVPELPANNLWKVLIAVLALGLVVGIAAFMKKKKK